MNHSVERKKREKKRERERVRARRSEQRVMRSAKYGWSIKAASGRGLRGPRFRECERDGGAPRVRGAPVGARRPSVPPRTSGSYTRHSATQHSKSRQPSFTSFYISASRVSISRQLGILVASRRCAVAPSASLESRKRRIAEVEVRSAPERGRLFLLTRRWITRARETETRVY